MSRIRTYGVALAVVGILAVASSCGSSRAGDQATIVQSEGAGETAGAVLARASESTSAVETGRMRATYRMRGDADGEPVDLAFTADGVFADFGRSAELTMDMSSMLSAATGGFPGAPESMVIREIVVDDVLYMQIETTPPIPGLEPGQWMRLDVDAMGGGSSADPFGGGMSGGPSGYLESLKAAGATVTEAGEDEIDGVAVTVLEGQIDPEDAVAQAPPEMADEVRRAFRDSGMGTIPFTAYVDDDGMVRRLEMSMTMGVAGSSMTMDVVIDLYDFDVPVTVTAPPPDQVVDEAPFGLGMLRTA